MGEVFLLRSMAPVWNRVSAAVAPPQGGQGLLSHDAHCARGSAHEETTFLQWRRKTHILANVCWTDTYSFWTK